MPSDGSDITPAYILAGGRSSRFGSDKARAMLDDMPLIVAVAHCVAPVAAGVRVVADVAGKYGDLGLNTIADEVPGFGPMGGLHAALRHRGEGWLLLVCCDLVGLKPSWIELLLSRRSPELQAIAFRHDCWEPLPALYHTSLLAEVTRRIERRALAMQGLLNAVPALPLPLPDDWPRIVQVNTPAELEEVRSGTHLRRS